MRKLYDSPKRMFCRELRSLQGCRCAAINKARIVPFEHSSERTGRMRGGSSREHDDDVVPSDSVHTKR